jgi:hypothetical protein
MKIVILKMRIEMAGYIQFLTAHCPSPWYANTEELFQFAAENR